MTEKPIDKTALILNRDGSIYHLNLMPDELADTIILVGDPSRVPVVSQHFEHIQVQKHKREFVTHTGTLKGKNLSVISTGIGSSNIDIVINECDALFNVDFEKRRIKDTITPLHFIRLGTCGGLIEAMPPDSLVLSEYALAFDGLLHFYRHQYHGNEKQLLQAVNTHFKTLPVNTTAYVAKSNSPLCELLKKHCPRGITLTCSGFYGPQHRRLRAPLIFENVLDLASSFTSKQGTIVNLDMETAAIYALCELLGHQCCSISTVLGNRVTQAISKDIHQAIEKMIAAVLDVCFDQG